MRFLTNEQARAIRGSFASVTLLARYYGVSRGCITNILLWRTYKDAT